VLEPIPTFHPLQQREPVEDEASTISTS